MNVEQVARVMRSMASGESRWIGSEGVHVYAFGSQVAGRFDPKALVFKVVADGRPYEGQAWMGCDEAAALVVAANEQADSRRAPAGDGGEGFQLEDEIMAKAKKVETKKQTKAPKVKATAKAPDSPPAAKARVAAKLTKAAVKAGAIQPATYQGETERVTAAARETLDALKSLPKPEPVKAKPAAPATETPDERLARLKAAARKAWEARRAQGWKHPKAKVVSPLIAKIDAQLAQSKAHVKQARETFKAIDAKKAERKKAEAVIKRVEKREKAKRLGQPINGGGSSGHGIRELKRIMGQAIGLN